MTSSAIGLPRLPLLRFAAALSCALAYPACIQPEYPDSYDEAFADFSADASAIVAVHDAGAVSLPSAAENPTNPLNPLLPIKPVAEAGAVQPFDAGSASSPVVVRDAGTNPGSSSDSGPRANPVLPDADAGSPGAPSTGPSRCTITASTDASDTLFYAGRYGCAVWISSSSNKLIKAFFLATKIASRTGLATYKSESAGMTVDVVAAATLNAPKQHQYTWMLTDSQGQKLPPGKYALKVELHSSNGEELLSLPFDTSMAPVSEKSQSGQIRSAAINCE